MIYFVFGRLLCHYVYFGVAKVAAKIVQASGMTKQNTQFLFFHSRAPPILLKDSANERKSIKFT